jgi:thiosulfate/3-mercaptopyruvate sulfurtransferase
MMTEQGNRYVNPHLLWSPAQLAARLGDPSLKILDVRLGEAYAMGHIVGARHFSIYALNTYDTDEAPLRSFTRMWAFLVGQRGITADDTVVVYGQILGMTAARGFWFFEYLGHKDIHVLDGGYDAWMRAGLPTTRDAELPKPAPYVYTPVRERVATRHDVLAAIANPKSVILDTRSAEEWRGTDRRADRGGTIPSAVHQSWEKHLTADGMMKPADTLRSQFEALGITPDKEVIALCNTGYRSAHAYLALRLLGYPYARNYVGSWQEWANRPELPVVKPD